MKKPHYQVDNATGESAKNRVYSLRQDVFGHYGGRCSVCGEIDFDLLVIDPLRRNGMNGTMYWLRKHGYPDGHVLICISCKHRKKVVQST